MIEKKWNSLQRDIFADVESGVGNTAIQAVAGAGKTSCLIESLKYVPDGNKWLLVAFSKKIASELTARAPRGGEVGTLHKMGTKCIGRTFKQISIDTDKMPNLLDKTYPEFKWKFPERKAILKTISLSKAYLAHNCEAIEQILDKYPLDVPDLENDKVIEITLRMMELAREMYDVIDYDDMIYFPNVLKITIPKFDDIFVDECFPYDQCIATKNDKIKIGLIYKKFKNNEILPLVKSFDESTNKFEFSKITNVWDRGVKQLIEIKTGKRKIKCTENHKFLTSDGWVKAKDLYSGCLIKTTPPVIKNNQIEGHLKLVLNPDQEQIVLGSFLGDGNIHKISNHSYRMKVIHGEDQQQYCQWMAKQFNSNLEFIKENGYAQKPAYRFTTKSFSIPHMEFPDKKDYCPQSILDKLDERGLAVWYMDDGSFNSISNTAILWTCSFDLDSQKRFVEKLKSFGISCKLSSYIKKGKKYFYIYIDAVGFKVLTKKISKYIHSNISYKTNISNLINYKWNSCYENFGYSPVLDINKISKKERVYDIEVAKNHNFIVCSDNTSKCNAGLIAHNCQDLNYGQWNFILKMRKKKTRVFIFGDPNQSIFGFGGTDIDSMGKFQQALNAKILPMSISYRCPKLIVNELQELVPEMQSAEEAIDGQVKTISRIELEILAKPGCFIISRINRELVPLALKFLKNKIPCNIQGKDLGEDLLGIISRSKLDELNKFIVYLDQWLLKQKEKLRLRGKLSDILTDKVECLQLLALDCQSIVELKEVIKKLFSDFDDHKKIILTTTHMCKGLERPDVFILDWTFRKTNQEEKNIEYVAKSRSMKNLYIVNFN